MSERETGRKRIKEGIDIIVDEVRSSAESVGGSLRESVQGALAARENVVMVRMNKESSTRLDELVEAGVVGSRSESAAFLIGEGIKASADLFGRISTKVEEIRKAKEELSRLLDESPSDGPENVQ